MFAQEPYSLTAKIADEKSVLSFEQNVISDILSKYGVQEYGKSASWSTEDLGKWRYFHLEDRSQIEKLKLALEGTKMYSEVLVEYTYSVNSCENPEPYNDPGSLQTDHFEAMNLPCAWEITQGDPSIGIGVLDIDILNNHDDLQGKISSINGNCDPILADTCGHGYAIAGGITAIKNNEFCVAGTAPNSVIDFWCVGTRCGGVWPAPGFLEASNPDRNIRIINVSATGVTNNIDAIRDYCETRGNTLVVSASNNNHAAYNDIPGVILVAQARANGEIVDNSLPWDNGLVPDNNIDIAVPSINLVRLQHQNDCNVGSGSASMAASFLSGIVSLMYSVNPCLTGGEAEILLKETSQPIPNANEAPWDVLLADNVGLVDAEAAVLIAQNPTYPEITDEVIWDVPRMVSGDVIVKNGGVLRISSRIRFMNTDDNIIVEKGGRLILDNAWLTSACENPFWGGIIVQGDPLESQWIASPQGSMTAVNSTIENAKIGVNLSDGMGINNMGGGVCIAAGLNLNNCEMGVFIDDYPLKVNNLPHPIFANRTRFSGCEFTINNDYPFENFLGHARLDNVYAHVGFSNSTFLDERDILNNDFLTYGISSFDSKFGVHSSTFTNLTYGLKASNISSINRFVARNNTFNNCFYGISARNVNFFRVTGNDNFIGGYSGSTTPFTFQDRFTGLAIDHCTGFVVEDNHFSGANGSLGTSIGILARNTSFGKDLSKYNEIKSNTFTQLRIGNLANGNNGGLGKIGGLVYNCNENLGDNWEDLTVAYGSVALNQKFMPTSNNNRAADNEFSNWNNGVSYSDINNSIFGSFMRYHYSEGPNHKPIYYPLNSVDLIYSEPGCAEEEPCTKCEKLSPAQVELYEGSIAELKSNLQLLQSEFVSKIDGGNTPTLLDALNDSENWNIGIQEVLTISPYVSEEVGTSLLEISFIPTSKKLDVYYENPELLQELEIWKFVEDNIENDSESFESFVMKRFTQSDRGLEQENIENIGRQVIGFVDALIRHYQYQDDETGSQSQLALALIEEYHTKTISTLANLQVGNWNNASIEANQIGSAELIDFFNALIDSNQGGEYPNSESLQSLAESMTSSENQSSVMFGENMLSVAQQQLHFQNEGVYGEYEDEFGKQSVSIDEVENDIYLNIFPNPVDRAEFKIEFQSDLLRKGGAIKIFTSYGSMVESIDVGDDNIYIHKVNASSWKSGLYFVVLYTEKGAIATQRMVIL